MNKKQISKQINKDIKAGIYDLFPVMKDRMEYLAHKLVLSTYVENKELTKGELKTLKENDYIKHY